MTDSIGYEIGYNLAKYALYFAIMWPAFKRGRNLIKNKPRNKPPGEKAPHVKTDSQVMDPLHWMTEKQRSEFRKLCTKTK